MGNGPANLRVAFDRRRRAGPTGPWVAHRPAFSMLELVAVIGILSILAGLLLPSLSGSLSRAKLTRDMVRMRDAAIMIGVYTTDHRDVYPMSDLTGVFQIGQLWLRPMLAGGYYTDVREVDDYSDAQGSDPSVFMSAAMAFDWRKMVPGRTVPNGQQRASAVRSSEVLYPSLKGLVFRGMSGGPPESFLPGGVEMFCCDGTLWEFPVAFTDTSVQSGHWRYFNGGRDLYLENEVGMPVLSTWSGVRGVDR